MMKKVTIVENKPHKGIVESNGAVDFDSIIIVQEWNMPSDKLLAVRLTFEFGQTVIVRGTVKEFLASAR